MMSSLNEKEKREIQHELQQQHITEVVKQKQAKQYIKQKQVMRREGALKRKGFIRIWLGQLSQLSLKRFIHVVHTEKYNKYKTSEVNLLAKERQKDIKGTRDVLLKKLKEQDEEVLENSKVDYVNLYGDEVERRYNRAEYIKEQNLFIMENIKKQFPIDKILELDIHYGIVETKEIFKVVEHINKNFRVQCVKYPFDKYTLNYDGFGKWCGYDDTNRRCYIDASCPLIQKFAFRWLYGNVGQNFRCLNDGDIKCLKVINCFQNNDFTSDIKGSHPQYKGYVASFLNPEYIRILGRHREPYSIVSTGVEYEWDLREWSVLYQNTVYSLGIILKRRYKTFGSYTPFFLKHVMSFL